MPTDPAAQIRERITQLQRRRRVIAGAVWAVAGLVVLFSLGTGTALLLGEHIGAWWGIAWMPSVAADVALVVSLIGDQVLAESGIRTPAWGKVLRYVAAAATLGLNTTGAVLDRDWVSAGVHAGVIGVLVAATEAAQAYVRAFGPVLDGLLAELGQLAAERNAAAERRRAAEGAQRAQERAEQDTRQRAATEAQRAAAEAQERASAAAAERASAEAEVMRQRAAADAERAEAQRVRQEVRQRRSQDRRAATPPPAVVRQADVLAAALRHHQETGALPAEADLVRQTGASRATAGRALREARQQLDLRHPDDQGLHLVPAAN